MRTILIPRDVNSESFNQTVSEDVQYLKDQIATLHQEFIRKKFDEAFTYTSCIACIETAKQLGFGELAVRMEMDLYLDTLDVEEDWE